MYVLILYIPLYRHLTEDGGLLLKHVGGFMSVYSLQFCTIYVHKLVCKNDCIHKAGNE